MAKEDNKRYIQNKRDTRYETAIQVAYQINCSGAAKVAKSPRDVYRTMKIEDLDEQEEREKIQGKRRHYRGSLSSQWKQHEEYLESKSNGNNL